MRYNLLSPEGLDIGFITDDPEFRWEVDKSFRYRQELERFIQQSRNYQMVVAGGDMEEDDVTPPEENVAIDDTGRVIRLASELPGEVPVQVKLADEMDKGHIADSLVQSVHKARRYVEDPSDAPDDANVKEGPQGGLWYETESTESEGTEEPTREVPTFDSTDEAADYIHEHFLSEGNDRDNVDIEGMDMDLANSMVNGFDEMVNEWNVPKPNKIEFVPDANYAGQMQGGTFRIGDLEEADRSKKRMGDPPLGRGFGVEGIVRHELGHNLQRWLGIYTNARNDNIIKSLTGGVWYSRDRNSGHTGFYNDNFAQDKAREVSEYAKTNPKEYFAESWTAYVQGEEEVLDDRLRAFFDEVSEILAEGNLDQYTLENKYEFDPEKYIDTPIGEREGEGQ